MALHPDIEALLDMIEAGRAGGRRPPMHVMGPEAARVDFNQASVPLDMTPHALPHVVDLHVPARDGALLPARCYAPTVPGGAAGLQPVLLYFHGGGFMVGSLDSHDALCRSLSARSGCAVVSVAYRLAPEHRFPTAVHDAVDALHWLRAHGAEHGLDPDRVALGGDSAGGTLAAVTALHARDDPASLGQPRLQLLIYPGTGAWRDTASQRRFDTGYLLEGDTIDWFYGHYLRDAADRADWRFAPLLAPDVAGAAPALVLLAEYDPLVDEGVAYARRLEAAGVTVTLQVEPGMVHEFMRMGNVAADIHAVHERVAAALARALRG
ncbi:alpha/beta hydrolase [Cupriavidus pauculus]|uniref:Alpha/beta hydrolase n=1 Tax=Cupriavidus pauculus TaxID=82633 RepID=A0A2N5CD75_9BURK|nr:alpha/beta hydrolase [Cupriavidus pauculus]PLQ00211.1 alpha/beta hydrolase [Cupriavidus pauculus]